MESINIAPIGEIHLRAPRSFVAIYDLVNSFEAAKAKPAQLARICCAAIGICWSEINAHKRPPEYALSECDPIAYGGQVMHWLIDQGVRLSVIYAFGDRIILAAYTEIPTNSDIENAQDFSEVSADL